MTDSERHNSMTHEGKRRVIMKRMIGLVLLAMAGIACFGLTSKAEIYVGQRVRATTPLESIDHSDWDRLLQKYVNQDGMVHYRAWHANAADRQALSQYLGHLSTGSMTKGTSTDAKLAFWINAYNAVTIHGILREFPTTSIRNHTARLVGYNIWKHLQLYVDGKPRSLEDIEHNILRKMNEPRIHFAIVCASISCPRLLNEAYTPAQVQEQLDTNARDFFGRRQNFQHSRGSFQLSAILDWFSGDFGSSKAKRLKTIAEWLPTEEAKQAAQAGNVRVSYLDYNWALNAQR